MSAVNVKNTTDSPLGLPRGPVVNPGATVRVEGWEKKQSRVVLSWLDAGALEIVDGGDSQPDSDNDTDKATKGVTSDDSKSDDTSTGDKTAWNAPKAVVLDKDDTPNAKSTTTKHKK